MYWTNLEKNLDQRRSKRVRQIQMGSRKVRPNGGNLLRTSKAAEHHSFQAFHSNAAIFIQIFLFGKLPISIQQDLLNHNKEDASPEEIKTFLHRQKQYNQFAQATTPQPYHRASVNQTDAPRPAQHQQSNVKRQTRRFGETTSLAINKDIEK